MNPINPRTAKLFQLTFAAKGEGLLQPPPGFWSSRPNFFVKFFMGIGSGSRNPRVIVRIFYLHHVILKLKVIDLERERWYIVHDLHFQGHGVAPRHLFIDFRTPWLKKHRYRHQDYISSMFLAKDTKNNENSALGPFKFCAARGRGTWEPT